VDFIDNHCLQILKEDARVLAGDQQAELLRRCQQHVWRIGALTLALMRRRIACASL